ncbi:23S rRNA (guanosine(2251)-2'-O)-methyltransferase RlmB [Anaerofustis sp.]|uniref:23S rRNA (guanosine(2251)-2'-O)-methyltransferase RlmB n=1 Tax=Anaerofustis sp. TaxID=1872517 RepID=UPI0025C09F22|nr:23S rRNA (guanosine(2251)-2'-O)-methyltransferase RlmB [Anaerofustis sp.]
MSNYEKVSGRNAVRETLKAGRNINKLYISENHDSGLTNIIKMAKQKGISIQKTNKHKLENIAGSIHHQGVVALCSPVETISLRELMDKISKKDDKPILVILDNITDPHNAGAIIRSAYCAGADGVIMQTRRSASIGEGMYKSSAGAIEHIDICEVSNIAQTIDTLKKEGLFVVGLDMDGENYYDIDYDMPLALVVGAEGKGLGRLVKEKCDFISSIPLKNNFDSLNASVAAGIVLFEAVKNR